MFGRITKKRGIIGTIVVLFIIFAISSYASCYWTGKTFWGTNCRGNVVNIGQSVSIPRNVISRSLYETGEFLKTSKLLHGRGPAVSGDKIDKRKRIVVPKTIPLLQGKRELLPAQ